MLMRGCKGLMYREFFIKIIKDICCFHYRGITWSSLESFFSWAQASGSTSKNELQLVSIKTGRMSIYLSVLGMCF